MVEGLRAGSTPKRRLALALLGGILAGLGQVPFSLTPVALGGLALCAWLVARCPGARTAAWTGFAAGTGYFAVTLHWIVEPFLIEPDRYGWMAPFALVFISTGFALFWALAFGVTRRIAGTGWRFVLAFGACLAGVEMLRSYILSGFPWALLGYVWTESGAAQIAAWTGPFGLTLLTTLLAAGIAVAGPSLRGALSLSLAWVLPLAVGSVLMPPEEEAPADAPVIRLVQPNAPQGEKWDPDRVLGFFDRQLAYSAATPAPDLIVWPETSVPYLVAPGHPALDAIAAAADGVPVVLGAQRLDGLRLFNSLFVIGAGGGIDAIYDKYHLVPFGEYIPLGSLTRHLGLRSFAARDGFGYAAGPGPRLLDLGAGGPVLPLICYEAIFPQDVAAAPSRPDWLLQITNDAWFGTFAGPQQHLAQARMRTIEQGLPMIRVANTGISAVIDAAGRVLAAFPLGEAGYLDHRLPVARERTLYSRTGDLPLALLLLATLGIAALARRRESS
ncbi:apolipoprotein N-acyltransferase [Palleronia aestuarii]|uniref:Apolipoprotein N-acyltransferase n=1 Tax=Palleronia aestuarii TaxID=568105 RepID=A0A2W7P8P8_9RHOB|nr:apolipoprotein N-acyltransferase [Palleronia aestuarii]PZX19752.1 apolipoprotein N-acyltransferase [Palleronia aestuarii]